MAQRKSIAGRRSCVLYMVILVVLILIVAGVGLVLIVRPELDRRRQAEIRLEQAETHYQAGVTFQDVGDWEAAEAEFKQLITFAPDYKDVQTRLAELKARVAESEATATAEAQANARATAVAAPTATAEALEVHYQKGLGYINMGRWDEAKAELEQVFEVDPNYKDVQAKLAEVEAEVARLTPTAAPTPIATPTPKATATPMTNVIYSNDFEGVVGSEWGSARSSIDTTPSGRRFLGQFCNNTVSLTLNDLPSPTDVLVSFDLFIIQSWDGVDGSVSDGPDVWDLSVAGGQTLLHTTFANGHQRQSYPGTYPGEKHPGGTGAVETNVLGFAYKGDAVYHLSFTFPHSTPSLVLGFSASGLQGLSDESWGIDNVEMRVTSESP